MMHVLRHSVVIYDIQLAWYSSYSHRWKCTSTRQSVTLNCSGYKLL